VDYYNSEDSESEFSPSKEELQEYEDDDTMSDEDL